MNEPPHEMLPYLQARFGEFIRPGLVSVALFRCDGHVRVRYRVALPDGATREWDEPMDLLDRIGKSVTLARCAELFAQFDDYSYLHMDGLFTRGQALRLYEAELIEQREGRSPRASTRARRRARDGVGIPEDQEFLHVVPVSYNVEQFPDHEWRVLGQPGGPVGSLGEWYAFCKANGLELKPIRYDAEDVEQARRQVDPLRGRDDVTNVRKALHLRALRGTPPRMRVRDTWRVWEAILSAGGVPVEQWEDVGASVLDQVLSTESQCVGDRDVWDLCDRCWRSCRVELTAASWRRFMRMERTVVCDACAGGEA